MSITLFSTGEWLRGFGGSRAKKNRYRACSACGKLFKGGGDSVRKTCSEKCRYELTSGMFKFAPIDRVCPNCGKDFVTGHGENERKYCCVECSYTHRGSMMGKVKHVCNVCGESFNRVDVKYRWQCSKSCRKVAVKRRRKKLYKRCCPVCERKFIRRGEHRKRKYCSQKCFRIGNKRKMNEPEVRNAISKKISDGVAAGEIKNGACRMYKQGYYKARDGNKYWYQSGWELERMKALDEMELVWQKNTRIVVRYYHDGKLKSYVPDFYVSDWKTGVVYLEEVKGYETDMDASKAIYADDYCKQHGIVFNFIRGDELTRHPKEIREKDFSVRETRLPVVMK